MARKGTKSRRRIAGLRSKTTKARTHVDRLRAANADLKKKLAEALEQQTATSDVLGIIADQDHGCVPMAVAAGLPGGRHQALNLGRGQVLAGAN